MENNFATLDQVKDAITDAVEKIGISMRQVISEGIAEGVERAISVSVHEAERAQDIKLLITLEPLIKNDERYKKIYDLLKKALNE